jgi:thioredoxin-like negative regulator of GroEL
MSFAPTYSDIARHFHSNPDLKVKVGKVDTTEQRALGQRFSVNAYPSFFVVKGSSVYEFDGMRSKSNLIQFATKDYKDQHVSGGCVS